MELSYNYIDSLIIFVISKGKKRERFVLSFIAGTILCLECYIVAKLPTRMSN